MREEKGNVRCDYGFGKDPNDVITLGIESGVLPAVQFTHVCNPLPTGNHWKVIDWVTAYRKRGESYLQKMPHLRREFIKKAAAALSTGGFYMSISSAASKEFKAKNDLKMQRGKVYIFVHLLQQNVDQASADIEN